MNVFDNTVQSYFITVRSYEQPYTEYTKLIFSSQYRLIVIEVDMADPRNSVVSVNVFTSSYCFRIGCLVPYEQRIKSM